MNADPNKIKIFVEAWIKKNRDLKIKLKCNKIVELPDGYSKAKIDEVILAHVWSTAEEAYPGHESIEDITIVGIAKVPLEEE